MVQLNALAEHLSRGAIRVSDFYWCVLEPGQRYSDFLTPGPGFLFVVRGEGTFVFEGTSYQATPGIVLHGGGNMRLDYGAADGSELDYGLIHYTCADAAYPQNTHYRLHPGLQPSMIELLAAIRASWDIPGPMAALRTSNLFHQLMYETIAGCLSRSGKSEGADRVEEAIGYIQAHYMDPITLSDMAARFGISAGFFSTQFRKHVGISPIEYLIRFRIRKAKELLLMSRIPIRVVAQSVGYSDVYYFSRLFKQHTGMSPSRIRPRGRDEQPRT